jgi:GntR family transcriptional regulator, sialic acid-inducible nan operon repressor
VRAPCAEELTLAEHWRIIDAIADHDPGRAAHAMSDHLLGANELCRQLPMAASRAA